MAKFKPKYTVEAAQWFKIGDHPDVGDYCRPDGYVPLSDTCVFCGNAMLDHGWAHNAANIGRVCPGSWIVEEIFSRVLVLSESEFDLYYDEEGKR